MEQMLLAGYRSKGAVPQVPHRVDEHSGVGERRGPWHLGHVAGSATSAVRRKVLDAGASTSVVGSFVTTPCFSTSAPPGRSDVFVEEIRRFAELRDARPVRRSLRVLLRRGGLPPARTPVRRPRLALDEAGVLPHFSDPGYTRSKRRGLDGDVTRIAPACRLRGPGPLLGGENLACRGSRGGVPWSLRRDLWRRYRSRRSRHALELHRDGDVVGHVHLLRQYGVSQGGRVLRNETTEIFGGVLENSFHRRCTLVTGLATEAAYLQFSWNGTVPSRAHVA